jgi:type I restriction enzyme, S subunit
MKWPIVDLLDLCSPKQWSTISSNQLTQDGYPVYGANGQIGFYHSYNHEEPTILITCRGATCGTVNISPAKCYVTGNAMSLDNPRTDLVEFGFLYYALQARGLKDTVTGAAQPQITRTNLSKVSIPLPPLSEQRRIVEILDQADSLRKKRAKADAKAAHILPALFYKMFGDPATNPRRWAVANLEAVAEIGTQLVDPNQPQFLDLPHIGGEQLEKETGRVLSPKLVRDSDLRSDKFHFTSDYILYSKIRPYLNKVAFPRFEGVCSADIYPIRPRDSRLSHWYLVALLRSPAFLAYAKIHSERLRMAKLNREQLGAFSTPLPDSASLEIFERQASQVQSLEKARFEQADRISSLFNVLLHRAFSGDLTAKWRERHIKELLAEMEAQAMAIEYTCAASDPPGDQD